MVTVSNFLVYYVTFCHEIKVTSLTTPPVGLRSVFVITNSIDAQKPKYISKYHCFNLFLGVWEILLFLYKNNELYGSHFFYNTVTQSGYNFGKQSVYLLISDQ